MDFEFLDLTSDVMFRAYGDSEEELFVNSAKALFSVICDLEAVEPKKRVEVGVKAESLEDLLYEWLSTLLTTSEIEEMFFSRFDVGSINKKGNVFQIKGAAYGEDQSVEKSDTAVKGVTYYGFKIEKEGDKFKATVTLDI